VFPLGFIQSDSGFTPDGNVSATSPLRNVKLLQYLIHCHTFEVFYKVVLPYGKRLNKEKMEKIVSGSGASGLYMYFRGVGIVQGVQTSIACVYYLDPT